MSGCINYGSVEAGNSTAGGIAGELTYNTIVKDCVNEGSVSGRYSVGGIIGESGGGISNCLNLGSVVTSYGSNYQIGGIVGFKFKGSASNNYYAGACSVGGINGSDVAGQAMRGYTVSGESGLAIGLIGTPGLVYNGVIYAGKNESITISITPPVGYVPKHGYYSFVGGFVCDELVQNGDGWTLVMPNMNVTILGDLALALTVPGYGESTDAGWRLIASPVMGSMRAMEVGNLVPSDLYSIYYDLYRFDQSEELEWRNYKADPYVFTIENGKGYLYATKEEQTLIFAGTYNEAETQEVPLACTDDNPSTAMRGWNLVGNPFPVAATIGGRDFYRMNPEGSEIIVATDPSIAPMEGLFVHTDTDGETVTFVPYGPPSREGTPGGQERIVINLSRNGTLTDRAIVRTGEGRMLPKFQIKDNGDRLCLPQDGKDYAVAFAEKTGEIPLNFKAAKNGEYTLSFNLDGIELDYLHLIDNLTGADINLLATFNPETLIAGEDPQSPTPMYTFTAKTTDYASRFRLVFSACEDADGDNDGDNDAFAYISNGNIVITADARGASLQVMDVMGRVIVSRDGRTRCVPTAGMPAGVYVLRLIDGDSVRTQKIVIP